MILCLQICDSQGFPFYTRTFSGFTEINGVLLSGMVSAIGSLGKKLFKQDIATISFGSGEDVTYMVVVAKDLFVEQKSIYFVYYLRGNCDNQFIKEVSTTLFIENKNYLRGPSFNEDEITDRVDNIIKTKFNDFQNCFM